MNPLALRAWRQGFAPLFSPAELEALASALRDDSPELTQGSTTTPPAFPISAYCICEGGCAISYAAWKGLGLFTVTEVEDAFVKKCHEAHLLLREADCCGQDFISWFDQTPRDEMRRELLAEVERELALAARIDAYIGAVTDRVTLHPEGGSTPTDSSVFVPEPTPV